MKANLFKRAATVGELLSLIILPACATTGKSVGLGAAVGAGTGMAIGAIADPGKSGEYRTRNVIIGGAAGALTGMMASALIHSAVEKEKTASLNAGKASASPIDSSEEPTLIPAQWRAETIEAKRIGNRFVPRHIEYVITDPAHWQEAP